MRSCVLFTALLLCSWPMISCQASAGNSSSLNLLTFNTFLAFNSSIRDANLQRMLQMFRGGSIADMADVVCLQEVQEVSHLTNMTDAARAGGFPYSVSFLDNEDSATIALMTSQKACNIAKFLFLAGCLQRRCRTALEGGNIREVLACTLTLCFPDFQAANLSQACVNCINNQGYAGIASSAGFGQGTCFTMFSQYDFRSTYGLLLVSKYPLTNTATERFQAAASFFSRGYIRANVVGGDGIGTWTTLCTHLYPNATGVPYAGAFDNAGEENLANTRAIQNDPEVLRNTQVALMGDMNHGPQMDGQSHFQPSYDAVVNGPQSYCSPYVTQVGACTFCRTNPILALLGTMYSSILDHVYLKAPFLVCSGGNLTSNRHNVTSSRVFLPTPNSPIPPLSDHYGVLVSIDFPISASGASGLFWSFTSLLMSFALVVWAI